MKPASDRPPSILSEHGEGYCATCRFVVGLDATGMMDPHVRGRYGEYVQPATGCKGGGRRPAKITPYSSRKSAFRIRVEMDTCLQCGLRVEVVGEMLAWHSIFRYGGEKCPGSGKRAK